MWMQSKNEPAARDGQQFNIIVYHLSVVSYHCGTLWYPIMLSKWLNGWQVTTSRFTHKMRYKIFEGISIENYSGLT